MIFTTIQSTFRDISSELFKDRGVNGDVPCPVGESRVFALAKQPNDWSSFVYTNLEKYVMAANGDGKITDTIDLKQVKEYASPLAPPNVGVNFKQNNNSEEVVNEMNVLGYAKTTSGKNNYYTGGPSKAALKRITDLGGDVDSHTAPQHSNIRGYMCFQFCAFVLFNFCRLPLTPDFYTDANITEPMDTDEEKGSTLEYIFATNFKPREPSVSLKTLNTDEGHFLPYFTGMHTPDRNTLPRILLTYFSRFFETEAARVVLLKGYNSLATTGAGVQLAHLALVIERAIILRATTRVLLTSGSIYSGVIIETDLPLYKGNTKIAADTKEQLEKDVALFDMHETSLVAVCGAISSARLASSTKEEPKLETVNPKEITTPRQLHDLCRERVFTTEEMKNMAPHINYLNFHQTYWSLTDVSSIKRAIIAISEKTFPPMDVPIPYKTGILFTKDIFTSVLSAFGDKVPTLSSRGEYSLVLSDKPENMFNRPGTAMYPGFPIYSVKLSQATENWRNVFSSGTLHFACNKNGSSLTVKGCKMLLPKQGNGGIELARTLATHVALKAQDRKSLKRLRDNVDEEEEERIKKKRDAKGKAVAVSVFDSFFD
jgi:hypothetical protein